MRIKINFKVDNTASIPNNNMHLVNGYIHKCLGEDNPYHDTPSDYCVTPLRGGKLSSDKKSIVFGEKAHLYITSPDENFLGKMMFGISTNINFGHGLTLSGIDYLSDKFLDGYTIFRTLTPVLLKERTETGTRFVTIEEDEDYIVKLKEHIIRKFSKIDPSLNFNGFDINIRKHDNHRNKTVFVKSVLNKASQFDVIVKANKKLAEMVYNYGLGQSTGSGFGTVFVSSNHSDYYK